MKRIWSQEVQCESNDQQSLFNHTDSYFSFIFTSFETLGTWWLYSRMKIILVKSASVHYNTYTYRYVSRITNCVYEARLIKHQDHH